MRFNHSPFNSLAIAVAVGLAALTLNPMFASGDHLSWLPALLGLSATLGALGVVLRLPRLLTFLLQSVSMAGLLLWLGFRQAPVAGSSGGPWYEPLVLLAGLGTATVRDSTTPLPSSDGLSWLLLCILALVVLAIELLVNVLEQPAWSLAPLGVVYGVGAVTLTTERDWTAFAFVALGYALILVCSMHLVGSGARRLRYQGTRILAVVLVVGFAVALSPLLTNFVPLGDKQPWLQAGQNKPIELDEPMVILTENLQRPAEQVVMRYTTDSEKPVYLRTVALDLLTTGGVKMKGMQLTSTGLKDASTSPGRTVKTEVQMLLPSEYLPVPFAVDTFDAVGSWAYDTDTLSIVATGEERTEQTQGLEYKVTSTVPDPERDELERATAGALPADSDTLMVPEGLSPAVAELTDQVTAQAGTDGQKALAIQSFLRSEQFEYTLDAPTKAGVDVISNFLLTNNAGYCIHFAAGMMTMARLEGIPARMAIGFTPGKRVGDEWVVTTHNMHAWPELYFEGLGWVPFEPTKSVATPPDYTDPDAPDPSATPTASPSPSAVPSDPASATPTPSAEPSTPPVASEPTSSPVSPLLVLSLLGLVVLLALPFGIRALLARWRLRAGQDPAVAAENAWLEVQALFLDTRLGWSNSSPVMAATTLIEGPAGEVLGAPAASQLVALAQTVERTRYAREGADTTALGDEVLVFRRDLLSRLDRKRRAIALLLPSSLTSVGILSQRGLS